MTGGLWRSRLGLALRWAAGLALLYLALRGLNWLQVRNALAVVDWRWGLLALASVLASLGLKAMRWQWLLRGAAPRSTWANLLGALLAGQAANLVLPVRGGELSRVLLVAPASAARMGIIASIVAEKAFDLAALAVLAAGWLPGVFLPAGPAWMGAAAALAGAAGMWAVVRWGEALWAPLRGWADRRAAPGARRAPVRWGDEVLQSVRPLRSPGAFLAMVGITGAIWANMLITNLLLFSAFHLQAPILAGITVLVLVHVGVSPSLMPGNLGPFYFFTQAALLQFAVPPPVALGYAVVLHALVTLPPLVGGSLYLLAARGRMAGNPTT
jgi:uncharacterized membrane protein YbhN (UPF0104 family)